MIDVSLIGTGGMMPLHNRYLTSLCARLKGSMLLIDCGEGTQVTLKQLGWGFKAIDFICVTHFHADHISGLPGLLLTIGNSGRIEPLTIAGPVGLRRIVSSLLVIAPELPFDVEVIELAPIGGVVNFELGEYKMSALPLDHGVRCFGYSIELPRAGLFNPERAKAQGVPLTLWSRLQKGESVELDRKTYTPDMVLGPQRKGLKLSYVTDTRPLPAIADFVRGADLFVCEGLYGDDEKFDRVRDHKHMIFAEAAALARDGGVKELWLTHYSPAMPDPHNYVDNARAVFANSKTGYDRMTKTLLFEE